MNMYFTEAQRKSKEGRAARPAFDGWKMRDKSCAMFVVFDGGDFYYIWADTKQFVKPLPHHEHHGMIEGRYDWLPIEDIAWPDVLGTIETKDVTCMGDRYRRRIIASVSDTMATLKSWQPKGGRK